jgi:mono/diheme cytochrome c family protein
MKRFLINALLLIAAPAVILLSRPISAGVQAQTPSPPFDINQVLPPSDIVPARSGASLYQENCAPCHGVQGNADGPTASSLPSPATAFANPEAIRDLSPAQLFHTTKFGRIEKLMPPWQNQMSDDEIWRAVFYAWSLHTSQQQVGQGAALYQESCANCHGDDGTGDGPDAAEPIPDFTDVTYAMTRSQTDWQNGAQGADALEYIRTFSYIPAWDAAYRPGSGVIAGTVQQGTPGGASVEGAEVSLDAFAEFTPVATFTTTVDADGRFEFSDLSTDPTLVYFASSPAGGVSYSSPVLTLSPEQPQIETTIRVYETTDDPTGIEIDRVHWIIESQPGSLIAGQILAFGSRADRAYTGEMVEGIDVPVSVALVVPEGATSISFDNGTLGDRFRQVGNRIYDTTPMIPGEGVKQIVVRYALPFGGTQANIDQEFLYPVSRFNVLVADLPNLSVSAPDLVSAGSQDFQGNRYHILQGENLPVGTINLSISGLIEAGGIDPRTLGAGAAGADSGASSGAAGSSDLLAPWAPYLSGGLMVLVLAGAFGWAWQQGRISGSERRQELQRQRAEIMRSIAHLDDQHALGDISEEVWNSRRAHLKAQLLSVAGRLEQSPS